MQQQSRWVTNPEQRTSIFAHVFREESACWAMTLSLNHLLDCEFSLITFFDVDGTDSEGDCGDDFG